jgi:hypothetical protein
MFLLLGVSFLRGLKTLIFGGSNRERQNQQRRQYSQQQQSNRKQQDNPVSRKKIFTKDVGEYVDYEEVKEDKTDSAT